MTASASRGDPNGVYPAAACGRSAYKEGDCFRAGEMRMWTPMGALRVLVVEDDAMISTLLAEQLAEMGYDVCATVATEADAVAAASRYKPNLMIVDAGLGRGSGVSAVEQIERAGPLAHVFISGDAARVREHRPGAVVIRKPFRRAELAKAIELVLGAASTHHV